MDSNNSESTFFAAKFAQDMRLFVPTLYINVMHSYNVTCETVKS